MGTFRRGMTYVRALIMFLLCAGAVFCIGYVYDRPQYEYALYLDHEAEKEKAREIVRLYNFTYMDVFASAGVRSILESIPTVKELKHRLYKDSGFYRSNNLVMVYDMADLVFLETEIKGPHKAEVLVKEDWNFLYRNANDPKDKSKLFGTTAYIRYKLIKQDGKWLLKSYTHMREPDA
jgi:hypothetical protein